MKQTYYIGIVRDGEPMPDTDYFVPWKNCTSVSDACGLAALKYLRDAGYLHARSSRETIALDAYCFPAGVERHANGVPVCVMLQKLKCTPSELPVYHD